MAWSPISLSVPQYVDSSGTPYSGAVLKAYTAGTSTPINLATDSTGGTTAASIALNASGYPAVSGTVVIPHVSASYKLALYPTQAAADANSGALWSIDNLSPLATTTTNLAASSGSSLVGFIQSGTGAVARTLQDRDRERVSLFDFMTAAQRADVLAWTFQEDVTTAMQAAITYCETKYGAYLVGPAGGYKISSTLRVQKSLRWVFEAISVTSSDSDYTTDAGSPNVLAMGAVIWQSANNTNGLLVQQTTTGVYGMVFHLENVLFIGALTIGGVGPGGTTGNGIQVDAGSTSFGIKCVWKNVYAGNWRGYGINLVEGYYGSDFENVGGNGCGLTGFRAVGTSQGEYAVRNLRCFGNGANGATEPDQAGAYIESGGSGVRLDRISCTANYRVQLYVKGTGHALTDFQSESFAANNAGDSCIIISGCRPMVIGANFSPQSGFLGKILNLKNTATNGILLGLQFSSTVDPTGYHVYEEAGSASNLYHVQSASGTIYNQLQPYSMYGGGTDAFRAGTATNNDAAAGTYGEFTTATVASGSAVSLTTATGANVTSISLTAGDWDVSGTVDFTLSGATTTYWRAGVNVTSATLPSQAGGSGIGTDPLVTDCLPLTTVTSNRSLVIPPVRVKLTATTTIYLVAECTFSAGTVAAFGTIRARRPR